MTRVIANLCMSVDGFIADPDDRCDELFGWYESGEVPLRSYGGHAFRLHPASRRRYSTIVRPGTGSSNGSPAARQPSRS